jgi:isocitrate lyase
MPGRETWHNAKEEAAATPLLKTEEEVDAARDYFREFGAWSEEELAAMSAQEVNALAIQYVSGDIRAAADLCPADDDDIDWAEYEALASAGTLSGNLFESGGRVFFSMSH